PNVIPVTSIAARLAGILVRLPLINSVVPCFIQAGAMTMRQILMPVGALSVLLVVGVSFAAPAARQAARPEGPCGDVMAACERAGFARGDARGGAGLQLDCIDPIMQGTDQPRRARMPLP